LSNKNKIPLAEAGKRVAHVRYGDEWIGRLTRREEFLIKRYGGPQTTSVITPINSSAFSLSGPLRDELDHALFRREWKNEQYEWVEQWFEDHGFDPDHDELDRDAFELAFEKAFGSAADRLAPLLPADTTGNAGDVVSTASKHFNERSARDFVADYIKGKENAGLRPTQGGLEDRARERGYHGGRELLRKAFHELASVKPGRPTNSPNKFAKK
jgi:hypothetical protein